MTTETTTGVALLLLESVTFDRQKLPAGKVFPAFDAATAERLIATGAAIVPPAAPEVTAPAVVTTKEVERTVAAFSSTGHRFLKIKSPKAAAEFVAEQVDAAVLAELQALEYRREGGPRTEVAAAIGAAMAALSSGDKRDAP